MPTPTLKTNPFTEQYGALKGWQWAGVIGVLGGVLLFLKSRSAAKAAAPAGPGDTTSSSVGQGTDAYGNPIPGQQILAPIILQQGTNSTPTPTPAAPPKPKTTPTPGYTWQLVGGQWRQVHFGSQGPLPPAKPKPTTKPLAGYSWQVVNGVWRQVRFGSQGPLPPAKPAPKAPTVPRPVIAPRVSVVK
jgi:hypothetical protein